MSCPNHPHGEGNGEKGTNYGLRYPEKAIIVNIVND